MSSLEERLARVEARLDLLEDIESVRKTIARYCKGIDDKDIDALAALFAADAQVTVSPWGLSASGHAAVVDFYAQSFHDSKATRHYLSNAVIEPDGQGYRSHCYFQNAVDSPPQSLRGWGIYEDRFIREDGAWKFLNKRIEVQVLGPFDEGWSGAAAVADVHAGMREDAAGEGADNG